MSSSEGTKVTKDPEAFQNPKAEGAGVVTSDSLAGESLSSGGTFAQGSSVATSKQPSSSTTTNTTDTSAATQLDPAPDAEARQASEGWSEQSQLSAGSGLSQSSSGDQTFATSGGSSGFPSGGKGAQPGFGDSGNAGAAPNYVNNPAPSEGDNFEPHGQNIQEGGFSGDEPNASFNNDVGGENDPGRAALGTMQARDVPVAGGAGARHGEISNDGQFDSLDDTSA